MHAKAGDTVTIQLRGLVVSPKEIHHGYPILIEGLTEPLWLPPACIVSVEPRPLEIHDRVKRRKNGMEGTIVAIEASFPDGRARAWISASGGLVESGGVVVFLDELERV